MDKATFLDELMQETQRYYSANFAYITSDQPTLSILTNIARHFAQWGADHTPLPEDTVLFNKGVAEGRRLEREENLDRDIVFWKGMQYAREQMLKDGNVILTEEDLDAKKEKSMEWGYNLCKEQMMKEAVEGEVVKDINNKLVVTAKNVNLDGFKFGEKVRIIIVKEDEK